MYIFKHFCIETVSLQISSFPTNQKKKKGKKSVNLYCIKVTSFGENLIYWH